MNAMWELSLYADRQMTQDISWPESAEGKQVLGIIARENERLRTVACIGCGKQIHYKLGTCPHCGYVEFK